MSEFIEITQEIIDDWDDMGGPIDCKICSHKFALGEKLFLGTVMWEKHDEDFEKPWKWPHTYYFDLTFMCEKCKNDTTIPERGLPDWLKGQDDADIRRFCLEWHELSMWVPLHDDDFGVCNVHSLTDEDEKYSGDIHEEFQTKMFEGHYNHALKMLLIDFSFHPREITQEDMDWVAYGWTEDYRKKMNLR